MDEAKSPRIGETGGPTECVSSSALMECGTSPGGPPLTRRGAVSKEAKKFAQFLRDLERDFCWSILCLQEFSCHRLSVTRCLQRLHVRQRRLAIVVAAETLPFLIGGSFCVKVRNCALNVCWERKKFRVICSHLNSLSVMDKNANDLDNLRSLVTSRGSDMHVHICVDAQTSLRTIPPRLYPTK